MKAIGAAVSNRVALWLEVLQHGFVVTLPVVILGAFAVTFSQMLIWFAPEYRTSTLAQLSTAVEQGVFGFFAIILAVSVSAKLARHYQARLSLNYNVTLVSLLTLVCLASMIGLDYGSDYHQNLGMPTVAKALFCAIVFTEIYVLLFHHRAARLGYLNQVLSSDLHVAIRSIWPALVAPIAFLLIYYSLDGALDVFSHWFPMLMGEVDVELGLTWWQSTKLLLVNQVSWFVGIHGSSIVEVYPEILLPHQPDIVYSKQSLDVFVHIGGAGGTLGLVLALLVSKKSGNRQLGMYALIPSLFNINELIIFGLPIIFNRFLLIPFLAVPVITASLFRIAFELQWVDWQGGATIWSTPFLLGGYLATGQWQGVALQVICVAISFMCYRPFFIQYQRYQEKEEAAKCQQMLRQLDEAKDLEQIYASHSKLGRFSRSLMLEFHDDLKRGRFKVHYQPKVNTDGRIVGAEALFRYEHVRYGKIVPGLIVKLAETSGEIFLLGERVIERTLSDIKHLEKAGIKDLKIAINVSPLQLNEKRLVKFIEDKLVQFSVDAKVLEIEITEGQQIDLSDVVLLGIQRLSNSGIKIAVDDFGMGYTSLRYLKSFPIDTLKIDGSIVKDVVSSKVVQEIVSSMSKLTHSMDVQLVAEWVETKEQLDQLITLGCDQFQGELISMPVPLNELVSVCGHKGLAVHAGEDSKLIG